MSASSQHIAVVKPAARLGALALALVLGLPAILGFFTDHAARSAWEKRELASWQAVVEAPSAKQAFAHLDDFLEDHIGLAMTFNRRYRQAQFYLFADSPAPNISVAKDGFVFFNDFDVTSPNGVLKKFCLPRENDFRRSAKGMLGVTEVLRKSGFEISYAFFPSKPQLYRDRLPESVPGDIRAGCRDLDLNKSTVVRLERLAREQGIGFYYPLDQMMQLRDEPYFYPPGNYHANSRINHLFATGLLESLGIDPGPEFSSGARLEEIEADLINAFGFPRKLTAWVYPYEHYGVVQIEDSPDWIKGYYKRANDFSHFETANPLTQRSLLMLSNSFGSYVAPHLAPGFSSLLHVNMNHLESGETRVFLNELIQRFEPTDILYLAHDGALPGYLARLDRTLN